METVINFGAAFVLYVGMLILFLIGNSFYEYGTKIFVNIKKEQYQQGEYFLHKGIIIREYMKSFIAMIIATGCLLISSFSVMLVTNCTVSF